MLFRSDFQPHRAAAFALFDGFLNFLQQVLCLLIDAQIGIARNAEQGYGLDLMRFKEFRKVGDDNLLQKDERLLFFVWNRNESRKDRWNLDDGKMRFFPLF